MTLDEFQNNSELVAGLRDALSQPIIKIALETIRENGPEFRTQPVGLTPTDASVRLGHICGYAEHHQRLFDLLEPPVKPQEVEQTFENPDAEKDE